MTDGTLYDTDIVAWVAQQVGELRRLSVAAPTNAVDWDHLIEEIEGVGRSQVSGVRRKLVMILAHLVKVVSAPDTPPSRGWRAEIGSFHRVVRKQFSPSMRQLIDWRGVWSDARDEADSGLSMWGDEMIRGLPAENPFRLDDLVGERFDIDAAIDTVVSSLRYDRGKA